MDFFDKRKGGRLCPPFVHASCDFVGGDAHIAPPSHSPSFRASDRVTGVGIRPFPKRETDSRVASRREASALGVLLGMTGAGFIDTLRKKTGFAGLFSYKYKNPPGDRWKTH